MTDSISESTLTVQGTTPYAQIPRWILRAGDSLSHGAVRLYGVIMTYADNTDRTAFPGQETLSKDLGVSVRSIRTYMKELEEYGAIKVERRRNKRTGNYYSNNYALIFEQPSEAYFPPATEEDFRITKPTTLTTPTGYMSDSDESDERYVSPTIQGNRSRDKSPSQKSAQADPISPDFYESDDRKALISNVQHLAKYREWSSEAQKKTTDPEELGSIADQMENITAHFSNNLLIAFPGMDDLAADSMMLDYGWEPPFKAASDRFTAAKWFNQFIHSLQQETGSLTWRGHSA